MLQKLIELFPMIDNAEDCVAVWNGQYIVYRDVLVKHIKKTLVQDGAKEADAIADAADMVDKGLKELDNALVLESWAAEPGCTDCTGCPAGSWTVCHEGIHPCRLGFEIEEKDGTAHPTKSCIRPKTVGTCYLIAKALNMPERGLLAGKLSREEYNQYAAEKEAAGC